MPGRAILIGSSVVAAACLLTGAASAAAPVSGSISGPVVSVKGSTFTVTTTLSPTGKSTVSVGKATTITAQETLTSSALKAGACVMASGQKNSKGVVAAQRISLTEPVKGACTRSFTFGRGGGRPGGGTGTPPAGTGGQGAPGGGSGGFGNFANFGFAFGSISSLKGDTLTVKGTLNGKAVTTTVTVSSKTQISKTAKVAASAIAVKDCAFVRGTSADKGVTVTAQNVSLTKPTATGCRFGFAGR
jgi:Domain of unknown function (DUF5666)